MFNLIYQFYSLWLTRPGLEPTIYRANYYADAVGDITTTLEFVQNHLTVQGCHVVRQSPQYYF